MPPKSRQDYEHEMLMLREDVKLDPENTKIQKRLDNKISDWFDTLDITVFIANNEQLPWDLESVGFQTCPMPTKQGCGMQQVGDYQYWIETPGKDVADCFGPMLVERKSLEDFYGTMYGGRERFYREVDRFKQDPRFNQMLVVIESDITNWRKYQPKVSRAYDETRRTATVTIDGKDATVASLLARGVMPVFAGSRERAPMFYRHLVRQNVVKNWERWIS